MPRKEQKTLREIKGHLKELKPVLISQFKVKSIEVFGSFTRGDQTEQSDIDLLVTFSEPYNLWELLDAKEFLAKKLHMKVDLVPKDSIKSAIKSQILQEATPI